MYASRIRTGSTQARCWRSPAGTELTKRHKEVACDEGGLIIRAQRGDLEAFNQLVLTYQSQAYNLAYRILGALDAADVTQEAFIRAYRGIGNYRGRDFRCWQNHLVASTRDRRRADRPLAARLVAPAPNQPP
ncbi:MAG: hypothetical protein HY326_08530 [Chloroflexi bacterium]|nr:hypothetical protein [Chloroflexota bacterium]